MTETCQDTDDAVEQFKDTTDDFLRAVIERLVEIEQSLDLVKKWADSYDIVEANDGNLGRRLHFHFEARGEEFPPGNAIDRVDHDDLKRLRVTRRNGMYVVSGKITAHPPNDVN